MARCQGARLYDDMAREGRVRCGRETGADDLPLCAGCRVIDKLQRKRWKKMMQDGLGETLSALNNIIPFPTNKVRKII